MENATLTVFEKKTKSQITEGISLSPINDPLHVGRKFITVRGTNSRGEIVNYNVGILNPDGTVEAQPGYRIEITDGVARNVADSDEE